MEVERGAFTRYLLGAKELDLYKQVRVTLACLSRLQYHRYCAAGRVAASRDCKHGTKAMRGWEN